MNKEILMVVDAVSNEKDVDREIIFEAIETALATATRKKSGRDIAVRVDINREDGGYRTYRRWKVIDESALDEESGEHLRIENPLREVSLEAARLMEPERELQHGDYLEEEIESVEFGRIAAQTAKQVIVQKVREAERARQFEEYKDRVGEVVNGIVKRTEFGNVTVDLGRAEAIMRRDETIPREAFRNGDRVRAYIYDVRSEQRGPQIFLSRARPEFMGKLFAQEVPEIYDGIIEIKAVARDPGSRAKIAVISHDSSIDPVGACVGMRGSRVQAVVGELQGEKIDIIPWSEDTATFVVNALQPAEVTKVVLDEDAGQIEVVVPDEQLSLAIGRRGQNVRLASQLSGWDIDILTEEEESQRRQEEFRQRSQLFMEGLDVDDVIAHLLVAEGFTSIEQVAYVEADELAGIEGFDEEIAEELRLRASSYLEEMSRQAEDRRKELGVTDEVAAIEGLSSAALVKLGDQGVKTLDDFADLASDELIEILGDLAPSVEEANEMIMAARAHWFEDEDAPAESGEAAAGEAATGEEAAGEESSDEKESGN
ncbi:MAG: transcription termination factor NusA [Limibacillus sp.]